MGCSLCLPVYQSEYSPGSTVHELPNAKGDEPEKFDEVRAGGAGLGNRECRRRLFPPQTSRLSILPLGLDSSAPSQRSSSLLHFLSFQHSSGLNRRAYSSNRLEFLDPALTAGAPDQIPKLEPPVLSISQPPIIGMAGFPFQKWTVSEVRYLK